MCPPGQNRPSDGQGPGGCQCDRIQQSHTQHNGTASLALSDHGYRAIPGTHPREVAPFPGTTGMTDYSTLADDFYINVNLNTEMPLPVQRETVLGFFERVQKSYPSMRNFFTRENGDFVLEEDKEQGQYRWTSIEPRRLCSGYVNPDNNQAAFDQHKLVLELAPYLLSVSPLDCEALDYMLGFDFTFRGNHDALVAEALGVSVRWTDCSSSPVRKSSTSNPP